MDDRYGTDVLAAGWRAQFQREVRRVPADRDLVVECAQDGFCGAVTAVRSGTVELEDRHGRTRVFPLGAGFLLDGEDIVLVPPTAVAPKTPARTASGSFAVADARARVARPSRILVEGRHDAELVEKVWGDDLRVEGIVVERLDGADHLAGAVRAFGPGPGRHLGVLLDHLVEGSKESRLAREVHGPHVLVTGHPYVDVWQGIKPKAAGIERWPDVPRGQPWKDGVCAALGVADPGPYWKQLLASVRSYADLEPPLVGAVEQLIDFVTLEG
jgi:hypothetical protein